MSAASSSTAASLPETPFSPHAPANHQRRAIVCRRRSARRPLNLDHRSVNRVAGFNLKLLGALPARRGGAGRDGAGQGGARRGKAGKAGQGGARRGGMELGVAFNRCSWGTQFRQVLILSASKAQYQFRGETSFDRALCVRGGSRWRFFCWYLSDGSSSEEDFRRPN